MNIFAVCLNAVLPSFLMMLVGYFARSRSWIDDRDVIKMNRIVFRTMMPAMLFYNIYSSDFSTAVKPGLIAYAVAGVFAAFFLSLAYVCRTIPEKSRQGVMIQALFRSNFVVIGLPIAGALVENETLSAVSLLAAVVVPVFNMLAVICLEVFSGGKPKLRMILADILKNPLVLASLAGLLFSAMGWKLPSVLDVTVRNIGKACTPVALFLLGAFFKFDSMKKNMRYLLQACVGRLVVIPGIFLGLAAALGFRGMDFAGLLGIFASATAVNSFTMAQQMGGDAKLAGDIVVATSMLCSFTLCLWSLLFKTLGVL